MFGSEILEVAIGIILVFLLVSIICAAAREGIEGWLKTRAAFLEHGLRELLHDRSAVGIVRSFYTHPLINGLYSDRYVPRPVTRPPSGLARGGNLPTYIPSRNFALALMDIAARGPEGFSNPSDGSAPVLSLTAVRANVINLENAQVQRVLLMAIDTSQGDLDKAVANVAAWYDSAMDRVSGGYKRATQKILLVIGLCVAVGLNVNTITIADYLYRSDAARAAIVARAEAIARDSTFLHTSGSNQYAGARAALDSLRLPIGWAQVGFGMPWQDRATVVTDPSGASRTVIMRRGWWDYVFAPLLGWVITALAATFGAPFWFDLLNKVMVVRSTVKPHEKSPEESSEDRQSSAAKARIARGEVGAEAPPVGAGGAAAAGAVGASAGQVERPATQSRGGAVVERDPEEDWDGCDVELDIEQEAGVTTDEALPPSHGGVA